MHEPTLGMKILLHMWKKSIKIILANPELFQALKLAEKQQESMRTSDVSVCIGRALIYGVIQMTASFKST